MVSLWYTTASMQKQERKFTLAEVHTKMGAMGEIRLDQALLDVLSIKPGDSIVFSIDAEGVVTLKGEKQAGSPQPAGTPRASDFTQAMLFTDIPIPANPKRRARRKYIYDTQRGRK
jgi:hypothetical protein